MNRIALVSSDESVRVASPEAPGIPHSAISPRGQRCAWPTWSPDGEALVYSAYPAAASNGHGAFRIVSRPPGEPATSLYVNEPGTDAIAQHTPHYMMWSPDGAKLAFVAQTLSSGLSLFVSDAAGSGAPVRLLDGGPLFFCWSSDSRRILAHSRELHYLIDLDAPTPAQVPVVSLGYQAPSVSPSDGRVAICGELSDTKQGILIANFDGGADMVDEVEGAVSFSWRPDGVNLAVARDLDRSGGYYGRLALIDVATSSQRILLEEPLLCFFWSPDGSKIAYIAPSDDAQGSVCWGILDLKSGDRRYTVDFMPSREQLTMFMFFDQYSQSHRLWSPDSRKLLFTGVLGRRQVRAPLPDGGASVIYIADADGSAEPTPVGTGSIAVWSA